MEATSTSRISARTQTNWGYGVAIGSLVAVIASAILWGAGSGTARTVGQALFGVSLASFVGSAYVWKRGDVQWDEERMAINAAMWQRKTR